MNVLIADDSMAMRASIKSILEEGGHKVVGEASNGQHAFENYKELKPDLVTMDITMPRVDGVAGIKLIKAYDENAKIVICSALGNRAIIFEAMENGAIDFIEKPFEEVEVLEKLKEIEKKYFS